MSAVSRLAEPVDCWLKRRARFVAQSADWDWVAQDPVVNRLAPAVYLLEREGKLALSEAGKKQLALMYWQNKGRWLLYEERLKKVNRALAEVGVEVIPLKGAAFIGVLYEDSGLRPMADVDLLVRPGDFLKAVDTLLECDLRVCPRDKHEDVSWFRDLPAEYWPKEVGFYDASGLTIELHQALIASWFQQAFPVDLEGLWQRSVSLGGEAEAGKGLWTRKLAGEDTLAYLCLHLGLHGLDFMQTYLDMDQWLRKLPEDWDWERFVERVGAWQIRSATYHALTFCREFMDTPLPEGLLARLDPGGLARFRVRLLVGPSDILANRSSLGRRYLTLVRLALVDDLPVLWLMVWGTIFPKRMWYNSHPARKSWWANWRHLLDVVKRGD